MRGEVTVPIVQPNRIVAGIIHQRIQIPIVVKILQRQILAKACPKTGCRWVGRQVPVAIVEPHSFSLTRSVGNNCIQVTVAIDISQLDVFTSPTPKRGRGRMSSKATTPQKIPDTRATRYDNLILLSLSIAKNSHKLLNTFTNKVLSSRH